MCFFFINFRDYNMIKSPLRYPGGKSRIASKLVELMPENMSEYREPMVGGGSVFIYVKQKFPDIKVRINEYNRDLYCFWKIAKENNYELVKEINQIKKKNKNNGKKLFDDLKSHLKSEKICDFERAINFFILNRISFSGLTTSGGFSKDAFNNRFTASSIEKILNIEPILQNVDITHGDYSNLLNGNKMDVLIYLDPPYFKNKDSKLYGKNGDLHTNFDHNKFYECLINCQHNLLITYDFSVNNLKKFQNCNKFFISLMNMQYGMNNVTSSRIPKKTELIITNYRNKDKKHNSVNNTYEFHNPLMSELNFSIIKEIDQSVAHWKKVTTLQKEIFMKNGFKCSISEPDFKNYFMYCIDFLKNKKFLDLSTRKGCGKVLFKLYKWNFDEVQNLFVN